MRTHSIGESRKMQVCRKVKRSAWTRSGLRVNDQIVSRLYRVRPNSVTRNIHAECGELDTRPEDGYREIEIGGNSWASGTRENATVGQLFDSECKLCIKVM